MTEGRRRKDFKNTLEKKSGRRPEHTWPDPHRVSEADFTQICKEHKILASEIQRGFRSFLDELAIYAGRRLQDAQMLARSRLAGSPSDISRDMDELAGTLGRVSKRFEALFPALDIVMPGGNYAGWQLLEPRYDEIRTVVAITLSHLISTDYLAEIVGVRPPATSPTLRAFGRSQEDRNWKHKAIQHQPRRVILETIGQLQHTLLDVANVLKSNPASAGNPPYMVAPFLVVNLAEGYARLGYRPAKAIGGPFGRFTEDVVGAMGLPTAWIAGHLRKGVSTWEKRTRKESPPKS